MPLVVALEALPPRRLGKLRRNAAVSPSSCLVKGDLLRDLREGGGPGGERGLRCIQGQRVALLLRRSQTLAGSGETVLQIARTDSITECRELPLCWFMDVMNTLVPRISQFQCPCTCTAVGIYDKMPI